MMALYNRAVNKSGGEVIDISLAEAAFRSSESALIDFSLTGKIREREGNRNLGFVPAEDFETKDGKFVDVLINPTRLLMTRESEGSSKPYFVPDHCFNSSKECKSRLQHVYFDYNFY